MPEEKRKINAWIPVSLYNKLENSGYDNITQALIKALENFREDTKGYNEDIEGYLQDISGYKQDIEGYKEDLSRIQKDLDKKNQDIIGYIQDIERLKEDLDKRPDLVTLAQLQARYEGLQEIIREKDKSIERLENDLNKAGQREEDLKQLHNNYMLQVQSLINARAISAPSGSRTTKEANRKKEEENRKKEEENRKKEEENRKKEESRPAQTEERPAAEKYHTGEGEKDLIQKTCKYCGKIFYTNNIQKEYCSKDHKDTAYNEKRRKERESRKQ